MAWFWHDDPTKEQINKFYLDMIAKHGCGLCGTTTTTTTTYKMGGGTFRDDMYYIDCKACGYIIYFRKDTVDKNIMEKR